MLFTIYKIVNIKRQHSGQCCRQIGYTVGNPNLVIQIDYTEYGCLFQDNVTSN